MSTFGVMGTSPLAWLDKDIEKIVRDYVKGQYPLAVSGFTPPREWILFGTKNRGGGSQYEIHFNRLNERHHPANLGWTMNKAQFFVRMHVYVLSNDMEEKPDEMYKIESELRRIIRQGRASLGQGILTMTMHDFFDSNDEDQYPSAGSQMKNAFVSGWHSAAQIDILLYDITTI